jgi:hypothetical protein
MSTTIKRVALVAVAALGLSLVAVAPSNAAINQDTLTLSAATAAQTTAETFTATSAVATLSFLGAVGDSASVTAALVSGPAGNTALPYLRLTETASATINEAHTTAVGTAINSQVSGYTLVAGDAGKTISITTGGVTIPNAVMAAGDIVTIYNNSASSQTITQGASLTLQFAGQSSSTTGNRTLGLYGMATLVFISSSNAVITGAGLT